MSIIGTSWMTSSHSGKLRLNLSVSSLSLGPLALAGQPSRNVPPVPLA